MHRGDLFDDEESRTRYAAYSRLQAAAVAFGESLPIPEIVAIGGQSDGKSSLLEAFLGFRFNVREVEMGTRRPLIVQMFHNPEAKTPTCRLQAEDSEEYGPPIQPETAVAEAIRGATEKHLRQMGKPVSAKPIMMRAEYAYCPNLTIIDTPGFIMKARAGEPEGTPEDIMEMVKREISPPHRLILFLQQASVEWCSSLWMHVVQDVDPHCQRTVIVSSKFDNRVKEFAERWEVDQYLSASGYLSSSIHPFFVALPKERSTTTSAQWRQGIQDVDGSILAYLRDSVAGGFDEAQYGDRLGFSSLKRFLEEELARKYKEAAPATLAILQQRCDDVGASVNAIAARLNAVQDVASLRKAGLQHVFEVARRVQALLDGTAASPAHQGLTTAEERSSCSIPQWPGVQGEVRAPSGELRLYGGAAFERCLCEFQTAARILAFPAVAKTRVANVLMALKLRGGAVDGAATAAQDIARSSAREALAPLMDAAAARLAAILRRTFDLALDTLSTFPGPEQEVLRPYVAFHAALRLAFAAFIGDISERCRSLLQHHLEASTSQYAASSWASATTASSVPAEECSNQAWDDAGENGPPHVTDGGTQLAALSTIGTTRMPLRESQMTVPETPSPVAVATLRKKAPTAATRTAVRPPLTRAFDAQAQVGDSHVRICTAAEGMFGHIREALAGSAVPAVKAALLEPVSHDLAARLAIALFATGDNAFMDMFTASNAVEAMQREHEELAHRLEGLQQCRCDFQELARCL